MQCSNTFNIINTGYKRKLCLTFTITFRELNFFSSDDVAAILASVLHVNGAYAHTKYEITDELTDSVEINSSQVG